MKVLMLRIEDDLTVLNIDNDEEPGKFAERVAQLADIPVEWAVAEVATLSDWGPGDIYDGLAEPGGDLPTTTAKVVTP